MTRFTPLWLQAGSYAASVDRRLMGALWPTAAVSGCAVTAPGGMDIAVAAGSVAVPLLGGVGSVLCVSDNVETVTLDPAPAAGLNRIDLVICQARGADIDGGLNNDFVFDNVTGDPAATPVAPVVPANAVALASVYLVGGSAAVDPARITDTRPPPLNVGASQPATTPRGWLAAASGPTVQTDCPAAATSLVTVSWQAVAGRRYRVTATLNGSQVNAAASPRSYLASTGVHLDNPQNYIYFLTSVAANSTIFANASVMFSAAASGPASVTMQASTTAGVVRCGAGLSYLAVEDVGAL